VIPAQLSGRRDNDRVPVKPVVNVTSVSSPTISFASPTNRQAPL